MSSHRRLSPIDRLIGELQHCMETLTSTSTSTRPTPGAHLAEAELSERERRHAAGLMRVNHAGEVCAQALYQGQALTARLHEVRSQMEQAASEERDHLAWCEERLKALQSHSSRFNSLWYGLSFGLGAAAGAIGDRVSLGFVAATEEQVSKHLERHLDALPEPDAKSRAVVEEMLRDELQHARSALDAGGLDFPTPVKLAMSLAAKVMTSSSYYL